jgi:hypothetical protein
MLAVEFQGLIPMCQHAKETSCEKEKLNEITKNHHFPSAHQILET